MTDNLRCWHKDLIPLLPDHQLLGQWRECSAIASNLAMYGTPRHILVNVITEYPIDHFYTYTLHLVHDEMARRHFKINDAVISRFYEHLYTYCGHDKFSIIEYPRLYDGWFSTRYLQQCILRLEESYDRGGIDFKDWFKIVNGVRNMSTLCDETFENLFT